MALTPSIRFKQISWMKNHKNHCFIAKYSTVRSLFSGDSIITARKRYNVWKKHFSDTMNFGIGGDRVENVFWWVMNLQKMPYLAGPYYAGLLVALFFGHMALKGPKLYVCLWEFDSEHLKNNANKGRCKKGQKVLRTCYYFVWHKQY